MIDRTTHARCEFHETAVLYVLGSLDPEASVAFQEHLQDGCDDCQEELQEARETVAEIDQAAALDELEGPLPEDPTPRPDGLLRNRLLRRVEKEAQAGSESSPNEASEELPPGISIVAQSTEGWGPMGFEGIDWKILAVDEERDFVTALIRMKPGASYPAHRHVAVEECYVLSGELHVGPQVMKTGDYQVAEKESVHPVQWTETGCTLFVTSSRSNEMLV